MRIGASPSMLILNTMQRNQSQLGKSVQRLSTGLRINAAADDAAGMAMSEKMTAQLRGQQQASENVKAGIDMFRTADGALSEVQDALQRMRELSVYAANGTLTEDDRSFIQSEIGELTQFIDDTIGNSRFNKIKLFKEQTMAYYTDSVISALFDDKKEIEKATATVSSLLDQDMAVKDIYQSISDALIRQLEEKPNRVARSGGDGSRGQNVIVLQAGANEGDGIAFDLGEISLKTLGILDLDVSTQKAAAEAVTRVDEALKKVAEHRALVGAEIGRMESIVSGLEGSTINLESARSRIMDADIAKEMLDFITSNLLTQSAANVLKLSEESRERILALAVG